MHHRTFERFVRPSCRPLPPSMASPHVRAAFALLVTVAVLHLQPARANVPEYRLGDVAEADVITPVALQVPDPDATEALREKVSQEVRYVVRHTPDVAAAAEEQLRDAVMDARRAFRQNLQPADLDAGDFERVIRASSTAALKSFPFAYFAWLWTRGQSDEPAVGALVEALHAVMAQPIVLSRTETPLPANEQVRLVRVANLDVAPTLPELEQPGTLFASGRVLSLARGGSRRSISRRAAKRPAVSWPRCCA